MIIVEQAILHLFDMNASQAVLSDEPLELSEELQSFLEKHIEKCLQKSSGKAGSFQETSVFKTHVQSFLSDHDFVAFSKEAASLWFDVLRQANEMPSSDLLVCDVRKDEVRYLALLRIKNQRAFVHRISQDESKIRNEILTQTSVLPVPSASGSEESVLLRVEDQALFVSQKKYEIDGNMIFALSEAVLECFVKPSQQETNKAIQKTAEKVAKDFGTNPVQVAALAKKAIADEVSEEDELDPIRTGRAIFSNQPAMQDAFWEKIQNAGFAQNEKVSVNRESVMKKIMNHKLKTDTGIELTIPAEYFDNTEFIEFNHAEDGSLYITLKHIGSIVNRG